MNRIKIVDYLRGYSIFTIAIMHLIMGHLTGASFKISMFGGAGAHVFILCSGFGLYLSYLGSPMNYGEFLKRRFGKVWIPYAIAVMLWGGWYLLIKGMFPLRTVASHLLLYKMFSTDLYTSLCYPYWFISAIVQFYLAWPLIVRLVHCRGGYFIALTISLAWSTLVGILGYEDVMPLGSFFLQYLWEFCLGMWIAERCMKADDGCKLVDVRWMKWWWLLAGAVGGMGLSAFMAWNGGILKLYNDIPSLIGYLCVALLIYKLGIKMVNRFFEWTNSFSYELYLMHSLVYTAIAYLFTQSIPMIVLLAFQCVTAFLIAYGYKWILDKCKIIT